jgi:hypothetical protein
MWLREEDKVEKKELNRVPIEGDEIQLTPASSTFH